MEKTERLNFMKEKNGLRISKASILFYVASVVFLLIAAFEIYQAYLTVETYKATYSLEITDILNLYFTGCVPYFGFAFISYGIGEVLKKLTDLSSVLLLCMDDAKDSSDKK